MLKRLLIMIIITIVALVGVWYGYMEYKERGLLRERGQELVRGKGE